MKVGMKVVWAVPTESKPILCDVFGRIGKIRTRFSNKTAGKAYVRTAEGILEIIIQDTDKFWIVSEMMTQRKYVRSNPSNISFGSLTQIGHCTLAGSISYASSADNDEYPDEDD